MLSEKQEKINTDLLDEYEQEVEAQKSKFEEHLRFSVDSALEYKCSQTTADEWLETPELTAKLIIELQRHAEIVSKHLGVVHKAETTESVRTYTETRFTKNEESVETLKEDTNEQIDFLFRKNDETLVYTKKVEEIASGFRKKYSEDMAKDTLRDLVPNLTEQDVLPDTEANVIEADPSQNPKAAEARMFTLEQMQHLFNVLLKRSNVQHRITKEESCIRILEQKVAQLEGWRPDIEQRIQAREVVDEKKIQLLDDKIEAFKGEVQEQDSVCTANHQLNDDRHEDLLAKFQITGEKMEEIQEKQTEEVNRVTDITAAIEEAIDKNYVEMGTLIEEVRAQLTATLEGQKKTIQNLKFELVEILDTKQENMQRQFDIELTRVKQKYEDAIKKVDEASRNLQALFKKKVLNIKEKSALFFAKMEMKFKESNDNVYQISGMFREWQETLQGPQKKYEAQIFSLKNTVGCQEVERESEFTLMREVVKKLVHALEDKATTEIITANASPTLTNQAISGFTSHEHLQTDKNTRNFHLRKGSVPVSSKTPRTIVNLDNNQQVSKQQQYPLLPAITPGGSNMNSEFQLQPLQSQQSGTGGAGYGAQGPASNRLFLRRLNHLKDKLEHEMDLITVSRDKNQDLVPRGGKSILAEKKRERSEEYNNPNSDNNIMLAIKQQQEQLVSGRNFHQNQIKSVRDWAQGHAKDDSGSSSLMKKAQENVLALQYDGKSDHDSMSTTVLANNQIYAQQVLANKSMTAGQEDSLIGIVTAQHSPALQNLFTTANSNSKSKNTRKRKLNIESRIDLNTGVTADSHLMSSPSASTIGAAGPIMLSSPQPKHMASLATLSPDRQPRTIDRHRVSNAVSHDLYLKEEQIAMQKIMNREQAARMQQDIVNELGMDMAAETERDMAVAQDRYEQQVQTMQEVMRKKQQLLKHN